MTLVFLAGNHTLVDRGIVEQHNRSAFALLGDVTALPSLRSVIGVDRSDKRNNCCGGAVCVHRHSKIAIYGKSRWVHNVFHDPPPDDWLAAPYWGGALFADASPVTFEGEHNFTHNVAGLGGGVYVRDTEFSTKGIFRMENNTAYWGGALHALGTRYHSEGVSIFSSN